MSKWETCEQQDDKKNSTKITNKEEEWEESGFISIDVIIKIFHNNSASFPDLRKCHSVSSPALQLLHGTVVVTMVTSHHKGHWFKSMLSLLCAEFVFFSFCLWGICPKTKKKRNLVFGCLKNNLMNSGWILIK